MTESEFELMVQGERDTGRTTRMLVTEAMAKREPETKIFVDHYFYTHQLQCIEDLFSLINEVENYEFNPK